MKRPFGRVTLPYLRNLFIIWLLSTPSSSSSLKNLEPGVESSSYLIYWRTPGSQRFQIYRELEDQGLTWDDPPSTQAFTRPFLFGRDTRQGWSPLAPLYIDLGLLQGEVFWDPMIFQGVIKLPPMDYRGINQLQMYGDLEQFPLFYGALFGFGVI